MRGLCSVVPIQSCSSSVGYDKNLLQRICSSPCFVYKPRGGISCAILTFRRVLRGSTHLHMVSRAYFLTDLIHGTRIFFRCVCSHLREASQEQLPNVAHPSPLYATWCPSRWVHPSGGVVPPTDNGRQL